MTIVRLFRDAEARDFADARSLYENIVRFQVLREVDWAQSMAICVSRICEHTYSMENSFRMEVF